MSQPTVYKREMGICERTVILCDSCNCPTRTELCPNHQKIHQIHHPHNKATTTPNPCPLQNNNAPGLSCYNKIATTSNPSFLQKSCNSTKCNSSSSSHSHCELLSTCSFGSRAAGFGLGSGSRGWKTSQSYGRGWRGTLAGVIRVFVPNLLYSLAMLFWRDWISVGAAS